MVENENLDLIPTQKIGFVVSDSKNNNPEIKEFIKWVLTEGQKYNHDFGFLSLSKNEQLAQVREIENQYLSLNK